MSKEVFAGDNRPEDVRWLRSLSEPEIDLLIGLKDIAVQRAKAVGRESLADKFDLKMLRALSYILMQHVKGQINDLQSTEAEKLKEMLEGCSLLKFDLEENSQNSRNENLSAVVDMVKRRRTGIKSSPATPVSKRKRTNKRNIESPKMTNMEQTPTPSHPIHALHRSPFCEEKVDPT